MPPPVTKEDEARARREIEGRTAQTDPGAGSGLPKPSRDRPAAGPHADPDLVNPDATPGSGTLPPADGDGNADSTSG